MLMEFSRSNMRLDLLVPHFHKYEFSKHSTDYSVAIVFTGMLYPQSEIDGLQAFIRDAKKGAKEAEKEPIDILLINWMKSTNRKQFVVIPCPVEHTGQSNLVLASLGFLLFHPCSCVLNRQVFRRLVSKSSDNVRVGGTRISTRGEVFWPVAC